MRKRIVFSVFLNLFTLLSVFPQITMQNIGSVKVDKLSDIQIQNFVSQYTKAGYSFADVENYAKGKGLSAGEIEKLRFRVQTLDNKSTNNSELTLDESNKNKEAGKEVLAQKTKLDKNGKVANSLLFGSDIFQNSKMTFEPSFNIPTPKNYQLGPGDELLIDVFGLSENTMRLVVSQEGYIRIPNVGQVQVNGMTIENAEKIIKKNLSSIYSSINNGRTTVTVSLGNIRSIKVYLVGEVTNPGTYTLSSLATVFNALYACGGPSSTGSLRNIKVLRNGKEITVVDLYSFLLKGELENNITLQEQDVIHIPPYENRVTVEGALKRVGIYEMKPDETLTDLIAFCGGFNADAYKDRISVTRNTDNEKSVADIPQELFGMFYPQSGDSYSIGNILDKYSNRVQIMGSVFRPGVYALEEGMSLKDLVVKADGLKEDAYMQRATISRLKEDLTPELIAFNVQDLIDGNFNIELKKEDIVSIGNKSEFEESKTVSIFGQVISGGTFPYYENMTLKDLIFMAKGFREFAATNKIEIVRRITDKETLKEDVDKMEVITLSIDKNLNFENEDDGDFLLLPKDQVSVRMQEGLEQVKTMDVLGEVRSAGNYTITNKKEKISDVLARAGGITQYAYPKGAFLIRKSNRSTAERMRDLKLIQRLNDLTEKEEREELERQLFTRTDLVGIRLDEILKKTGSDADIFVENGDIIFVPKQLQTVTVAGAVQIPGMILYNGRSFKKYINEAGGFSENANKKRSYVAYANGSIASTKRFLFFKSYPKIEPGAHVFVPEKIEKPDNTKENISFFTSVLGSIVSIASVVVSVIILSQK